MSKVWRCKSPNTWDPDRRVEQLMLTIDATAGTSLTRYKGQPSEIEFLKFDVINLAHHLRRQADVLVSAWAVDATCFPPWHSIRNQPLESK